MSCGEWLSRGWRVSEDLPSAENLSTAWLRVRKLPVDLDIWWKPTECKLRTEICDIFVSVRMTSFQITFCVSWIYIRWNKIILFLCMCFGSKKDRCTYITEATLSLRVMLKGPTVAGWWYKARTNIAEICTFREHAGWDGSTLPWVIMVLLPPGKSLFPTKPMLVISFCSKMLY